MLENRNDLAMALQQQNNVTTMAKNDSRIRIAYSEQSRIYIA